MKNKSLPIWEKIEALGYELKNLNNDFCEVLLGNNSLGYLKVNDGVLFPDFSSRSL